MTDTAGSPADPAEGGDALGHPVVCLLSSAGGLLACERFFEAMPAPCGMAFLVVPHLDPRRESQLVEILARRTPLRVSEATQGERIEPDHVYVLPPDRRLEVRGGRLCLDALPPHGAFDSVMDHALRSLSLDQGRRTVAVVLSGTGHHGEAGLKEVKLAGGVVLAQSPSTAEHDAMPLGAIEAGLVDMVLPPEEMPRHLLEYRMHPYLGASASAEEAEDTPVLLERIVAVLRARGRRDFTNYRRSMILRRVQRRMGIRGIASLVEYLDRLQDEPEEVVALDKDLLIGVTAFFRDPGAFEVLATEIVPGLVRDAHMGAPVRVWVPGCATGEEAYSVAILFHEAFAAASKPPSLLVFATDVDEQSLAVARAGIYAASTAGELSAERLRRFFVRHDDRHYRVDKRLRESIVFAPQDLVADAPFSDLDLVSCRNVLIYLEPSVQWKVVALFHFALRHAGTLLLGPSESVGTATDLFEPISQRHRVYRRVGRALHSGAAIPRGASPPKGRRAEAPPPLARRKVMDLMQREVIADHAPASILVNARREILCFLGPVGAYLRFAPGEPTRDLLSLARQGLRSRLRDALRDAAATKTRVVVTGAQVKRGDAFVQCTITVRPVTDRALGDDLQLVCLEDVREPRDDTAVSPNDASLVSQMEQELRSTREDLQSTIEELEHSNEELKASNEEVMSMNEELQSANEELETSKEEAQSLNEELSTVNQQLQEKIAELDQANSDLANFLDSTEIATLFLDDELRLQRFTPATDRLLNLLPSDRGRRIADLALRFDDDSFLSDCRRVLCDQHAAEKEVWAAPERGAAAATAPPADDVRWYIRRILPYRSTENRVRGVVVTFVDITDRKHAEALRARTEEYIAERLEQLEFLMDRIGVGVIVTDDSGRCSLFNTTAATILGHGRTDRLPREWPEQYGLYRPDGETLYAWEDLPVACALRGGAAGEAEVVVRGTTRGDGVRCTMHSAPFPSPESGPRRAFIVLEALADAPDGESAVAGRARFQAIVTTAPVAIVALDGRDTIQGFNLAAIRTFGLSAAEVLGEDVRLLLPSPWCDEHARFLAEVRSGGGGRESAPASFTRAFRGRRADGSHFPIEVSVSEIPGTGALTEVIRELGEDEGRATG